MDGSQELTPAGRTPTNLGLNSRLLPSANSNYVFQKISTSSLTTSKSKTLRPAWTKPAQFTNISHLQSKALTNINVWRTIVK